jgi:hypothetical protein
MFDLPLVAHPESTEPRAIARDLVEAFGRSPGLVLYFASSEIDFPTLARELACTFPESLVVGCTTCGEIGPAGCTIGRVSAFALGPQALARAVVFDRMAELKFDHAIAELDALIRAIGKTPDDVRARAERYVFVSLTDGLSGTEELLLAAIAHASLGVELVGGSAADDFRFTGTAVAVGERVCPGGAALLLVEPHLPFWPFHLHHFVREGSPMVVTEAEPTRRRVSRIDGYPAVSVLARVAGFDEAELRADPAGTLATRPAVFGFMAGPTIFMRSVMNVSEDGLLLGGPLEEGTVIYRMRPGDLIDETRRGIATAMAALERPESLLLFNCGGRIWEASSQGRTSELAQAMLPIRGAGFTTYGEQFRAVHLNHTLTGLVFGRPR